MKNKRPHNARLRTIRPLVTQHFFCSPLSPRTVKAPILDLPEGEAMVQGRDSKLSRTKSEMDVDGPSNGQGTHAPARVVFSQLSTIIPTEPPSTPHIPRRPPTPFYTPSASSTSSPDDDDEHIVDMGSSQDSQVSHMSFSETMDSEDLPGTREPTPVPELPQTQGLQKMQSVVFLGPATTSVPPCSPTPPLTRTPSSDQGEFLQKYLLTTQKAQAQQLEALTELARSISQGMSMLTQEVNSLKEEVKRVGSALERPRRRPSESMSRIQVRRYSTT
ncbi:hypothetical protein C8Q78DRAFT_834384 [Trametes maxima]|nr:hypothetical protein C8Q78DRAFT_834384 [Trametes maxima]